MTRWTAEVISADAIMVRFGEVVSPEVVPLIRAAGDRLREALGPSLRDLVPSYTTLMVSVDPLHASVDEVLPDIEQCLVNLEQAPTRSGQRVEIPVWYDLSVGPDLARVAEYNRLTIEQVIEQHSTVDYCVYAIGFAPGFAYMGEVSKSLATPRLSTPRQRVPVGSVALADRQTAVYPVSTPGGWNLLGRTPVAMFDREREGLCPVSAGDWVRFVPISKAEFMAQGGELP